MARYSVTIKHTFDHEWEDAEAVRSGVEHEYFNQMVFDNSDVVEVLIDKES